MSNFKPSPDLDTHRWTVQSTDNGIRVCRGLHHRSHDCEWVEYIAEDRITELRRLDVKEVTDGFDAIFYAVPEACDEKGQRHTLASKIVVLVDKYAEALDAASKVQLDFWPGFIGPAEFQRRLNTMFAQTPSAKTIIDAVGGFANLPKHLQKDGLTRMGLEQKTDPISGAVYFVNRS